MRHWVSLISQRACLGRLRHKRNPSSARRSDDHWPLFLDWFSGRLNDSAAPSLTHERDGTA